MKNRQKGCTGCYRYGFNGKEKDHSGEWGTQTHYDYGFRIYNPSIGKFLSVDPLMKEYPELTPYQFASNTPISAIDLDGTEAIRYSEWEELLNIARGKSKFETYRYSDYVRLSLNSGNLHFSTWNAKKGVKFFQKNKLYVFGHRFGNESVQSTFSTSGPTTSVWKKPPLPLATLARAKSYSNELRHGIESGISRNTVYDDLQGVLEKRLPGETSLQVAIGDAFRHIAQSAALTLHLGEENAKLISDAHERDDFGLINNPKGPYDSMVDLVNNAWGRKLGIQMLDQGLTFDSLNRPETVAEFLNMVVDQIQIAYSGIGDTTIFEKGQKSVKYLAKKFE